MNALLPLVLVAVAAAAAAGEGRGSGGGGAARVMLPRVVDGDGDSSSRVLVLVHAPGGGAGAAAPSCGRGWEVPPFAAGGEEGGLTPAARMVALAHGAGEGGGAWFARLARPGERRAEALERLRCPCEVGGEEACRDDGDEHGEAAAAERARRHAASGGRWWPGEGDDDGDAGAERPGATVAALVQLSEKAAAEFPRRPATTAADVAHMQTLLEVGHKLQTGALEHAGHHVIWETVVQPTINALEAMMPELAVTAIKNPVSEGIGSGLNEAITDKSLESVVAEMTGPLLETLTSSAVNAIQKPAGQAISEGMLVDTAGAVESQVSRDTSRGLVTSLAQSLTTTVSQTQQKALTGPLSREAARFVNSAVIGPVALGVVPTLRQALVRVREDDAPCWHCYKGGDGPRRREWCDACDNAGTKEYVALSQDMFFARKYATYYSYFYGGYYADEEYVESMTE